MARYLYSELASTLQAYKHCTSESANESQREYADKHEEHIEELLAILPSGSGFDSGTTLDWDASHADKLVFTTSFHHMNEMGGYDGWTDHTITVTPSFSGINLRVGGRNRNDIKESIHECFYQALREDLDAAK